MAIFIPGSGYTSDPGFIPGSGYVKSSTADSTSSTFIPGVGYSSGYGYIPGGGYAEKGALTPLSGIFIPRWERFSRQPTGPVEIDYNNPLSADIAFCMVNGVDLISKTTIGNTNILSNEFPSSKIVKNQTILLPKSSLKASIYAHVNVRTDWVSGFNNSITVSNSSGISSIRLRTNTNQDIIDCALSGGSYTWSPANYLTRASNKKVLVASNDWGPTQYFWADNIGGYNSQAALATLADRVMLTPNGYLCFGIVAVYLDRLLNDNTISAALAQNPYQILKPRRKYWVVSSPVAPVSNTAIKTIPQQTRISQPLNGSVLDLSVIKPSFCVNFADKGAKAYINGSSQITPYTAGTLATNIEKSTIGLKGGGSAGTAGYVGYNNCILSGYDLLMIFNFVTPPLNGQMEFLCERSNNSNSVSNSNRGTFYVALHADGTTGAYSTTVSGITLYSAFNTYGSIEFPTPEVGKQHTLVVCIDSSLAGYSAFKWLYIDGKKVSFTGVLNTRAALAFSTLTQDIYFNARAVSSLKSSNHLNLAAFVNYKTDEALAQRLSANPWQIFQPDRRSLYFFEAGIQTYNLYIQNLLSPEYFNSASLTQQNLLLSNDINQNTIVDNGVLSDIVVPAAIKTIPQQTRISQPALAIIKPEYRGGLQISSPLAGNLQNNILPSGVSVTNSGATAAVTRDLKGFNCNGTSNYISYGDAFYSDVLTLLITWIPADAGDANSRSIVIKRNSSGTTNSGINELSLTYTSTGIYYAAWNSSGTVICNPGFSTSIVPGKPYHICVVHRGAGGIVSLWVNGSEVTQTISASAIRDTTNHLQIAALSTDNPSRWGKGIFTNFHAWSIARTDGLELSKNPWQIFQPDRRSLYFFESNIQSYNLYLQGLLSPEYFNSAGLTQQNLLYSNSIQQTQNLSAATLIQQNLLKVNNLSQSQKIDNVLTSIQAILSIQNIINAQIESSAVLTQQNILAINSLNQNQILQKLNLIQGNILVLQNQLQTQVVSATALIQQNILKINNLSQIQSLINTVLTQQNVLSVNAQRQLQALSQPVFAQGSILSTNPILQSQIVTNSILIQQNLLRTNNLNQNQSLLNTLLTQQNNLITNSLNQTQTLSKTIFDQSSLLIANNIRQTQTESNIVLTQQNTISVGNLLSNQLLSKLNLVQGNVLGINSIIQNQKLDNIKLDFSVLVAVNNVRQITNLTNIALLQANILNVHGLLSNQSIKGAILNQNHILIINDLLHEQLLGKINFNFSTNKILGKIISVVLPTETVVSIVSSSAVVNILSSGSEIIIDKTGDILELL